ncbi:sperm acrosome membrane-associated protein 4-like [Hemicordylus capensis]|uniref:sperm acrosome membrane-associated protein 4-like n=1 Tax=Hemicordylus capensis TaxID=884348 RepID=UPI0023028CD9|nr:sperm acrosome membrane-associated protein 4-like [Hemicordylus capensis]
MKHHLSFFICLLVFMLPPAFSKQCYFCEITDSTICPSTKMSCGEDEDCFVGQGAALGVSMIKNKGCTRAINCGREQPVSHMGVTYSLVTNCCKGSLCNAAQPQTLIAPSLSLQLSLISILLLGLL